MNLTYEDVFSYLKELKEFLKATNIEFDDNLYIKAQRKKLVSDGYLITYGTILEMCGLAPNDINAQIHGLQVILNKINENTKPVLLSALVVNGDTYLPGNKYFEIWHHAKSLSDYEKVELWSQDLKEIVRA